jgi:hypothetical protein
MDSAREGFQQRESAAEDFREVAWRRYHEPRSGPKPKTHRDVDFIGL